MGPPREGADVLAVITRWWDVDIPGFFRGETGVVDWEDTIDHNGKQEGIWRRMLLLLREATW